MDLDFLKSTHKTIEEHDYSAMSYLIIYHELANAIVDDRDDDLLEYAIDKIYDVWLKVESTNIIDLSDKVALAIINAKNKKEEFKAVDATLAKVLERK